MQCRGCSGLDRRRFLALAGGAGAAALLPGQALGWPWSPTRPQKLAARTPRRAKVALVFSHIPTGRPTWPTKDYDYDARRGEISQQLRAACPNVDFTHDLVAHNQAEAETIVEKHPDVDGFMVFMIGIWTRVADKIMHCGKPTIVVDDLYAGSGEMLGLGPKIRNDNLRAALVSSSDFDDVVRAARWLSVLAAMKGAKVINVKDADISGQIAKLRDQFGTEMVQVKSEDLQKRYEAADEHLAEAWAQYWTKGAKDIVGVNDEDIVKAGKMHVTFVRMLEDMQADAVTMDCLGFFYKQKSDAYPCLSFFEMFNQGLTGICEADVDSTTTALLMRYLCGRPGFVSDPVIDTSTGEIIYAHCVFSNYVFGPDGKANKYILRTHAEDRQGVSVQSLVPLGEPVTTLKVHLGDQCLLIHSAVTSRNVFELNKACRTKIAAHADADTLLRNWTRGWHRVTVFGDFRKDFINIGRLAGLTVVEEDQPLALGLDQKA